MKWEWVSSSHAKCLWCTRLTPSLKVRALKGFLPIRVQVHIRDKQLSLFGRYGIQTKIWFSLISFHLIKMPFDWFFFFFEKEDAFWLGPHNALLRAAYPCVGHTSWTFQSRVTSKILSSMRVMFHPSRFEKASYQSEHKKLVSSSFLAI